MLTTEKKQLNLSGGFANQNLGKFFAAVCKYVQSSFEVLPFVSTFSRNYFH